MFIFTLTVSFAQEVHLVDAIKMTEKVNSEEFKNITNPLVTRPCNGKDIQKVTIETEAVCEAESVPQAKDFHTFQIKTELENLPENLKKHVPGKMFEKPKQTVTVALSMPNDNKFLGLWGIIFGAENDGDDFGDSHGQKLETSYTTKSGLTFTGIGESYIFSKDTYGRRWETLDNGDTVKYKEQLFTNETMVQFLVDNIEKGKALYYKVGLGWIQLDSKNYDRPYLASSWQDKWHRAMTKVTGMYRFDYLSQDKVYDGINLESYLGWHGSLLNNKGSCRLYYATELGGRLSSLDDDFIKGNSKAIIYFQKPDKKSALKLEAGLGTKYHSQGWESNIQGAFGYGRGRFSTELIYNQKFGTLHNYQNYNTRNDEGLIEPIVTIKTKIILGKFRK